jgi:hypothetical protein
MNTTKKIVEFNQLQAGDVLLCVISGNTAEKVESITGSKYTHAGICYSKLEVVDMTLGGIQKTGISEFVANSEYIAIFRNPHIWNQGRVQKFHSFLDTAIDARLKYDKRGAVTFADRKKEHQWGLHGKLYKHFEEGLQPQDHKKLKYICSALVVASFIEIGFIQPSAAIAYQPDTLSAGDLGRDPTFGYFVGYLKSANSGEIPDDDEFANNFTLDELAIAEQDLVSENFSV